MKDQVFSFESYEFDKESRRVFLRYSLSTGEQFEEVLTLPEGEPREVPEALLDRALFKLHLIGGISYYKSTCAPKIEVKSGKLSKGEAAFWDKLYTQGLGEFFYENKIDFRGLIAFPYEEDFSGFKGGKDFVLEGADRALLPFGGGKDSLVSAHLLERGGMDYQLFNMGRHGVPVSLAEQMGKDLMSVSRKLSPVLFEMNKNGALNGHVPISAYISFLTVLLGLLYGYKWVVFSNERSANEGNTVMHGMEINHQYSKSLEFERDLKHYLEQYLTSEVRVFSLLRPLSEVKIAEIFSRLEWSFPYMSSCNRNFKISGEKVEGLWCGECPKCCFVFAIFSPYISPFELTEMFGENLYEDESLWPTFEALLGISEVKPFECVGTPNEVRYSIQEALKYKFYKENAVLRRFEAADLPAVDMDSLLLTLSSEHELPERFWELLKSGLNTRFLIVGFGREGRAVLNEIWNKLPGASVTVADSRKDLELPLGVEAQLGADYLKNLDSFDVIVKSPGVPWQEELVRVKKRVTSATSMFFSNLDASNFVIGVTGSKGKSTVSTLIYEVLKAAGRRVKLVGNIGEVALKHVDDKDTVFVMELSSYQLLGLNARVNIGVFTSFFPDHLDVHGTMESYLMAKAGLLRGQTVEDHFVYSAKYPEITGLSTPGKRIPVSGESQLEMKLLGQHNRENVKLVEEVAELMEVPKEVTAKVLADFSGLSHRLETVGTFNGITFVDDAIATTPEATLAALDVFGIDVGCIFLGGSDRGYDFDGLCERLAALGVANVVLFPDNRDQIEASFPAGYTPNVLKTSSMDEAVAFAFEYCQSGEVCLLSTASPSFSLFTNYVEQGKMFADSVKKHADA